VSSLIPCALLLSLSALAPEKTLPDLAPPDGVDIDGHYACSGKDANNQPYSGAVIIARRGDAYVVGWQIEENISVGVGLRQGNVLSVGFRGTGGVLGVCRYTIEVAEGKPILKGQWTTAPGDGKTHVETLTFTEPPKPDATDATEPEKR